MRPRKNSHFFKDMWLVRMPALPVPIQETWYNV